MLIDGSAGEAGGGGSGGRERAQPGGGARGRGACAGERL
jgi:hypothetical protein